MHPSSLETAHLYLVPVSPRNILTLIEQPEDFESETGFPAAPGLREFYVSDDVSSEWLAGLRNASGADPWQYGFFVVERGSHSAIGGAGFKGPPDANGMVEIAYGIVPSLEGRGYATESAAALVTFVFEQSQVRVVRAHTLPESNASTRVLMKCGFRKTAEVVDPDDGSVWRWELVRQA